MAEDFFGLVGQTLHGKYRVDGVVGEGGFGVVYRGLHVSLEQPIAIKCLKIPQRFTKEARQTLLERFHAEGKHLAKLSQHPAITRVFDFAVAAGGAGEPIPYLVLEWLQGSDLEEVLRERRAPFDEAEALAILGDVVDAVAFAHEQGIAHRDIKPSNVFLARTPRGPVVKLLDFGIAKLMADGERITRAATKTSSGFSAFTPNYGAPEQFRSETYGESGPWTDVHALGLVLVEMLSLHPALSGASGVELYQACMAADRPTPRRAGIAVSDGLEALCERALALDPRARFPSARELATAMAALTKPRPTVDVNADTALPDAVASGPPAAPPAVTVPQGPPTRAASPLPPAPTAPQTPLAPTAPAPPPVMRSAPAVAAVAPPAPTPSPPPSRSRRGWVVGLGVLLVGGAVATAVAVQRGAVPTASTPDERPGTDDAPSPSVASWTTATVLHGPPPRPSFDERCFDTDYPGCKTKCEQGHQPACMRLALMYEWGPKGNAEWPLDRQEATRLYRQGCDLDVGEGCHHTAERYEHPEMGVHAEDLAKARQLFTRGCELGYAPSCHALGAIYSQGRGTDKDAELTAQVLLRGCFDLSDNFSCRFGGSVFAEGRHLPKDLELARRFNEHGCKLMKDTMCCEALGQGRSATAR